MTTGRLPFDPERVEGEKPVRRKTRRTAGGGAAAAPALTVSDVARLIKGVLAEHVPTPVRVVGEVSNFSQRTHWFFSLKDETATLRCVCFATSVRKMGIALQDGMQVVATGRLDYYDAQGQLQLYVDRVEPVGVGALDLRLRALCAELRGLGYFEESRKKALPLMPRGVAVVTSRTGAAWQDVVNTTRRRWRGCRLLLLDVHVQGAGAAPEIAAAIAALSRGGAGLGVDAIILTRGGGSLEDLWAFNERVVADAVYHCTLPVVAAIGHETDVTVAELVADRRCATPTQAAMVVVPDAEALAGQVAQMGQRLATVARRNVGQERARLEVLARHPLFRKPALMYQPIRANLERLAGALAGAWPRRIRAAAERLAGLEPRLPAAWMQSWRGRQQQLEALARQLGAVAPTKVLQRGYSYTLGPDGHVLRSVAAVTAGDRIATVLADGKVHSTVEGEALEPEAKKKAALTLPSPRGRGKGREAGPGLFG
jgi:exodeoxyribonuclease VII large subunit